MSVVAQAGPAGIHPREVKADDRIIDRFCPASIPGQIKVPPFLSGTVTAKEPGPGYTKGNLTQRGILTELTMQSRTYG